MPTNEQKQWIRQNLRVQHPALSNGNNAAHGHRGTSNAIQGHRLGFGGSEQGAVSGTHCGVTPMGNGHGQRGARSGQQERNGMPVRQGAGSHPPVIQVPPQYIQGQPQAGQRGAATAESGSTDPSTAEGTLSPIGSPYDDVMQAIRDAQPRGNSIPPGPQNKAWEVFFESIDVSGTIGRLAIEVCGKIRLMRGAGPHWTRFKLSGHGQGAYGAQLRNISFLTPQIIYSYESFADAAALLARAERGRMTLINAGVPGFAAVVEGGYLTFELPGITSEATWLEIGALQGAGAFILEGEITT